MPCCGVFLGKEHRHGGGRTECELELVHLLLEPVNSSEVVIKIPISKGLGYVNCLLQCLTLFFFKKSISPSL